MMNKFSSIAISSTLSDADILCIDAPVEIPVVSSPEWGQMFLQADQPSLLIFGSTDTQFDPYIEMSQTAGFRVLGTTSLEHAVERLSMVVDVDAIILVCKGDEPGLDALFARLDMMAINSGVSLSIIVELSGLDRAHANIDSDRAFILCNPSREDIVVTLAMMAADSVDVEQLNDSGQLDDDTHMGKLSDELSRLTRTIEALVQNRSPSNIREAPHGIAEGYALHSPDRGYRGFPESRSRQNSEINAQRVRAVLRARRLRDHIFPSDLFADPAWDILLDLMAAHLENTRVSVSSLCIAAAVPPTTALRWIRQLTDRGLLERQADPADGRRIFIALTTQGVAAINRWFEESGRMLLDASGTQLKR